MCLYSQVGGLHEGKEYQFRVKAVNAEGESEPLETDTSIIAKNPYGEYNFYLKQTFLIHDTVKYNQKGFFYLLYKMWLIFIVVALILEWLGLLLHFKYVVTTKDWIKIMIL